MELYADVILPLPLPKSFTYSIPREFTSEVQVGKRVVVPFGKSKFYTGIVLEVHPQAPATYEVKSMEMVLDKKASVTPQQLELWKWMSSYYLCPLGPIMKAALPSLYLLESETILERNESAIIDWASLSDEEHLLLEALEKTPLTFNDVIAITGKKTVAKSIGGLLAAQYIFQQQLLKDAYKPKKEKQLRLLPTLLKEGALERVFEKVKNAPKQEALLLGYLSESQKGAWVPELPLRKRWEAAASIVHQLVKKEILETREIQVDRLVKMSVDGATEICLTPAQQKAMDVLSMKFEEKPVVLLEGITGSGKTAIYSQQIAACMETGQQVLYLLPEISLTTQIVTRLKAQFPDRLAVYHSKFNPQERAEVWQHVLKGDRKAQLIIGARSALFLPFQKLGLIVVDEEHENSYKQFDPAPRYQARDVAIVMAQSFKARVLLGSATPSLETRFQVEQGKYGYVSLTERYGEAQLPDIELVDLKEAYRKKQMKEMFSQSLIEAMQATLANQQQIILFHNRRGYSPILECLSCGHIPQCTQCDVSLTYHQYNHRLQCHYCGYHIPKPQECHVCSTPHLADKGTGTQQIESVLEELFPKVSIGRMDWDSTRGKHDFDKILNAFSSGSIQILVGTQMVVKGLDFQKVQLVGVINADQLINYPDFRAHERSVQMLSQVAGRAGRSAVKGRVLIQTYNPEQTVLKHIQNQTLAAFCTREMKERKSLQYPPYGRLVRITFKHRNHELVEKAAEWFANVIRQSYTAPVLGPVAPLVSRIQNQYLQQLLIKIPTPRDRKNIKELLLKTQKSFETIGVYRATRVNIDVDPY
ncbi:MAG: replication restart helicase PriA [Flavobacteriaceae bacterium]